MRTPTASRSIHLPLGTIDAVSGNFTLRIPLGPKLPGRIPVAKTDEKTGSGYTKEKSGELAVDKAKESSHRKIWQALTGWLE